MLIEYVPYGDLLGYLRKSRGLNDTYFKDPDIKPKTSLTSQQLMKFAWQIADGMSYLSLRKASLRLEQAVSLTKNNLCLFNSVQQPLKFDKTRELRKCTPRTLVLNFF